MLHPLVTARLACPNSTPSFGPAPQLEWIETSKLMVDDAYQRSISRRGHTNIRHIAENFDWSKFAPVIVAPVEGGSYAIIEGQHRTTAAMLHKIEKVPCQIVQADRAQQAAAFAAVNGRVTPTQPGQLFHARLRSGDATAKSIDEVCFAAGVRILRTNTMTRNMQVGDTHAVRALARCFDMYGRDTLITALQCITQTADGNAGFVRSTIVAALCEVVHQSSWRDKGEALLRAMDDFSFADVWSDVTDGRDQVFPATVRKVFAQRVTDHLAARENSSKSRTAA